MKILRNAVAVAVEAVLSSTALSVTKYLAPNYVVKATRRSYKRGGGRRNHAEVILTVGVPNYAERAFIKKCQKAGEPFPVKKLQIKWPREKK